jgi:putative membrane protein
MSLLSEQDSQRIQQAILRLEQRSAAEFVVAVVPRSDSYAGPRAVVTMCWAFAAAALYLELWPQLPAIGAVLLQVPVALVAWTLIGLPPVFRKLIPRAAAEHAVQARAFQLFAERGVHETRDRTGMLLLLSELERRVTLLGDRGIHERVGTEGWQKHVAHIVARIHEGRTADGVLEVLQELEVALARGVPIRPDDRNELPNEIVRGS